MSPYHNMHGVNAIPAFRNQTASAENKSGITVPTMSETEYPAFQDRSAPSPHTSWSHDEPYNLTKKLLKKFFYALFLLTGSKFLYKRRLFATRGSNSVVECNLAKVEVAGSNPVSRSRLSS